MNRPTDIQVAWIRQQAPEPDAEAHAFFNRMKALPTCVGALSLRSQAEINSATPLPPNRYYKYVWGQDAHPEAIDACKYTLPALAPDGTPLKNQETNQKVQMNLNWSQPGSTLIIAWEWLWTEDWRQAFLGLSTGYKFKTFQCTSPGDKIYFESRNLWGRVRGPQYVSVADIRNYDLDSIDAMAGSTLTGAARVDAASTLLGVQAVGFMPTGERAIPNHGVDTGMYGGLDVRVSKLYRYYKEIRYGVPHTAFESWNNWRPTLNGKPILRADGTPSGTTWPVWSGPVPPGTYNMLSEYMVPEDGDPICILDRVPAAFKRSADGSPSGIGKLYIEMNTSAEGVQRRGDAIAYGRNMVAWTTNKGLADDPSPLVRPVR